MSPEAWWGPRFQEVLVVGVGWRIYPRLHCHNKTKQDTGEIKRREVVSVCVLGPQVSPEKIMSREVELGCESWTFFASNHYSTAVQRTLSL